MLGKLFSFLLILSATLSAQTQGGLIFPKEYGLQRGNATIYTSIAYADPNDPAYNSIYLAFNDLPDAYYHGISFRSNTGYCLPRTIPVKIELYRNTPPSKDILQFVPYALPPGEVIYSEKDTDFALLEPPELTPLYLTELSHPWCYTIHFDHAVHLSGNSVIAVKLVRGIAYLILDGFIQRSIYDPSLSEDDIYSNITPSNIQTLYINHAYATAGYGPAYAQYNQSGVGYEDNTVGRRAGSNLLEFSYNIYTPLPLANYNVADSKAHIFIIGNILNPPIDLKPLLPNDYGHQDISLWANPLFIVYREVSAAQTFTRGKILTEWSPAIEGTTWVYQRIKFNFSRMELEQITAPKVFTFPQYWDDDEMPGVNSRRYSGAVEARGYYAPIVKLF